MFSFYSYRQNQREIAGSEALTQANISDNGGQLAEACLKIATDYAGTSAGQRALLEGATALFTTGKYADAQTAFQKFLDTYPDNFLTPQATLGLAASLDALGKTDLAVSAYQRGGRPDSRPQCGSPTQNFPSRGLTRRRANWPRRSRLYGEVARTYRKNVVGFRSRIARNGVERRNCQKLRRRRRPRPAPAASVPFNLSK